MTFSSNIPYNTGIKLSFFDNDGTKVGGVTVDEANEIWNLDNSKLFYFQNGDGIEQELTIDQVNQLIPQTNLIPKAPNCSTAPVPCGPPLVKFFGGGGFGASANAIISPISSSVIGFDIVNPGKGYRSPPKVELVDPCGKGSGSYASVNMEPDGINGFGNGSLVTTGTITSGTVTTNQPTTSTVPQTYKIKNLTVISPGNGYLSASDGSLGGNERVWKEPDEGYVRTVDGKYYVVQPYRPIKVERGSTYYPPDGSPRTLEEDENIALTLVPIPQKKLDLTNLDEIDKTYGVVLSIEEIKVLDPGFGYRPEDQLIITPDNGAEVELIVNDLGQVSSVRIINGGQGFNDFPQIRTNSTTGFNATFVPVFKSTPLSEIAVGIGSENLPAGASIIRVVDCVGKIPPKQTFNIIPR